MTTARKRAEDFAVAAITGQMVGDNPSLIVAYREISKTAGNAASDVWEPLLQEALSFLGDAHVEPERFPECGKCRFYKKLKEALG